MSEFRFDHAELRRLARERWGLRWPVTIQRRSRRVRLDNDPSRPPWYSPYGRHAVWEIPGKGNTHDIRLVNHDLRTMLETLAHELEHAAQCERLGPLAMYVCYAADSQGFERQAEAGEARWRELLPCIHQREEIV